MKLFQSHKKMPTTALMYHEIQPGDETTNSYALTQGQFEQQLRTMSENGYRSGSFADYWRDDLEREDDNDTRKVVIITFDDAHLTNYTVAFPALSKYGMTACFFIPTAFVGRGPGEVEMAHLAEMARHGNEIQSHSHSHPFLSSISREEVLDELGKSRDILEQGLGHRVDRIACPGGRYNSTVLDAAREAGYRGVCTSRPGYNRREPGRAFYVFDRILMAGATSAREFQRLIARDGRALARRVASYRVKGGVRAMLGDRLYHRVWEKVWWPS